MRLSKGDKAFLIFLTLVIVGALAWWVWSIVTADGNGSV